jgi:hypothetical protein
MGTYVWSRVMQDSPDPPVMMHHGTVESNSGEINAHFSKDGHLLKMFAVFQHGHGEDLSMSGRINFHQFFGSHDGIWFRRTTDGVTVRSHMYGIFEEKKSEWGGGVQGIPVAVANHDDYIALQIGADCEKAPDAAKYLRVGLYNHLTDKVEGYIPNPGNGKTEIACPGIINKQNSNLSIFAMWLGNDLPAPTETRPYLAPLDHTVTFNIGGASSTVNRPVEIWNLGGGDLSPVLTEIQPSTASWLSATTNGAHGNTQYVILSVDPAKITDASVSARVILSADNARNTREISLIVNKNRLPAPRSAKASKVVGKDDTHALITWAPVEGADGYIIETCGGKYQAPISDYTEKTRVDATKTHLIVTDNEYNASNTAQSKYYYRVRAFSNNASLEKSPLSLSSDFINRMWLDMVSPVSGMLYQGGQSIDIAWISNGVEAFKLEYSTDYGKTWTVIVDNYNSNSANGYHYSYNWDVPSTLEGKNVIVRVLDAKDPEVWSVRNSFAENIRFGSNGVDVATGRIATDNGRRLSISVQKALVVIKTPAQQHATAQLYRADGTRIAAEHISVGAVCRIPMTTNAPGMYFIRVNTGDGERFVKHFIHGAL